MLKGNANFYLGNYDAAIKNYQIALQLDPAFTDAENNLQKALQAKKETEKTAGITKIENEAIAASRNGNYEDAIRIFNSLLEKNPNEPKYHFFIGTTHASSGNMEAALESFIKAESLDDGTDVKNSNRMISAIIDTYTRLGDEASANAYRTKLK